MTNAKDMRISWCESKKEKLAKSIVIPSKDSSMGS